MRVRTVSPNPALVIISLWRGEADASTEATNLQPPAQYQYDVVRHTVLKYCIARHTRLNSPRPNPDRLRPPRQIRSEPPSINDGSGTDDVHWFACEWGGFAFDDVDAGGDEHGGGGVACVALEKC